MLHKTRDTRPAAHTPPHNPADDLRHAEDEALSRALHRIAFCMEESGDGPTAEELRRVAALLRTTVQ
ncbi:hypothetical protein [Streptomyces sp. NPDC001594]|uniref:hypothetical protein n=1 Tax=Streptomyces sp. NPDC001594 TaxID=3364590 RepID=UPI00369C4332